MPPTFGNVSAMRNGVHVCGFPRHSVDLSKTCSYRPTGYI